MMLDYACLDQTTQLVVTPCARNEMRVVRLVADGVPVDPSKVNERADHPLLPADDTFVAKRRGAEGTNLLPGMHESPIQT